MADYNEIVQNSIRNQLVNEPVLLQNPRGVSLSDVYASSVNSSLSLAEMFVATNRGRVSSNNLNFSGSSTFYISSSSLIDNYVLNATLTLTDTTNMVNPGWLFQTIREVQLTFNNSQLQNTSISGQSLYDYALLTCRDKETRNALLNNDGGFLAGAGVSRGSIPLGFMLQALSGNNGFPLDMSVCGNLYITIVFNPYTSFIVAKNGTALANVPTAFSNLEIVYSSIDLVDKTMAVQSILNNNPDLSYINPIKYITSTILQVPSYVSGNQTIQQINSFPTGNVVAMIISMYPKSWRSAAQANKYQQSVELDQITLEFSGNKIFDCQSLEEYRMSTLMKFGEPLLYDVNYSLGAIASGSTTSDGDGGILCRSCECGVYVVPLGAHMDRILRGNHAEVLTKYAGSTLQLTLKTRGSNIVSVGKNTDYDSGAGNQVMYMPVRFTNVYPSGVDYEINLTFVTEALLSVNRGVVKLIL